MSIRAIDSNGDFTFGAGLSNYKTGLAAVQQDIQTTLLCFLGDCFWFLNFGIDWFTFLGGKDVLSLRLAINSQLLNVNNVTGILQSNLTTNDFRKITIFYQVQTTYGVLTNVFTYDVGNLG